MGSLLGSKTISDNGKQSLRNVFYRYMIITMLAVGLKFVTNLYTNLIGGLIHGYCIGVLNICFQKVLIDTIPNEVAQQYGLSVNMGVNIGLFIINCLQSLICPFVADGIQELSDDENWKIILGFTWLLQLTSLVLIMFKYPDPSLKDALINSDNHVENLIKLSKIYKVSNSEDLKVIEKRLLENNYTE